MREERERARRGAGRQIETRGELRPARAGKGDGSVAVAHVVGPEIVRGLEVGARSRKLTPSGSRHGVARLQQASYHRRT